MAAITASHLTTANGGSSTTVYTTASITPTAGSLVVAVVLGSSGTPGAFTSCTGTGITYSAFYNRQATSNGARWVTVFAGQAVSPSSGTLTLTSSTTQGDAYWTVAQFANADRGGVNALVQHADSDANGTQAGITATLNNLQNTNNAAYGVFFWGGGSAITGTGGFTELVNTTAITIALESEYAINQTSLPVTWGSANNWSYGLALEISIPRIGGEFLYNFM